MRRNTKNLRLAFIFLLGAAFLLAASGPGRAATPSKPVVATPQMIEEAASLKAREDAVAAQEKENARRKLELDKLEKDVTSKLAKLTALQNDIQKKLDYIKSLNVQGKEFRNLIKVYSTMSASKVAPLLDEMTDGNVAKILRAMKPDAVAKIIPKLNRDKAVRVSRLLGMIN